MESARLFAQARYAAFLSAARRPRAGGPRRLPWQGLAISLDSWPRRVQVPDRWGFEDDSDRGPIGDFAQGAAVIRGYVADCFVALSFRVPRHDCDDFVKELLRAPGRHARDSALK
jgi:hypothetical protein